MLFMRPQAWQCTRVYKYSLALSSDPSIQSFHQLIAMDLNDLVELARVQPKIRASTRPSAATHVRLSICPSVRRCTIEFTDLLKVPKES